MWVLALALLMASPAEAEPSLDATSTPAQSHKIAIVWEAGAGPVSPSEYMDSLMQRLPPERFEPVTGDVSGGAWVVRVQQPTPGVYRLEVAPPGREPEARRLLFSDPVEARRRLAILTAFVLEQGHFPELVEGSGIEADEAVKVEETTPSEEAREPEPGDASGSPGEPGPPPLELAKVRAVAALGPVALFPTTPRGVAVSGTPGYGGDLDVGLRIRELFWTGACGGYTVHPGVGVTAHRVQGAVFAGVYPHLGRWNLGARLSALGGSVIGTVGSRRRSRPYFGGGLGVRGAWNVPGDSGVALHVAARTELVSRASTFTTDADGDGARGAGLGRVRFGVSLGVTWMSPANRRRTR